MKKRSVLLIQLTGHLQFSNYEPMAIEVLASYIARNVSNCVVEMLVVSSERASINEFTSAIQEKDFSLIGISVPQGTLSVALKVLKLIKEFVPQEPISQRRTFIVAGGALPSGLPELFIENYPSIIIVKGWGEYPLYKLINTIFSHRMNFENIPNIVTKEIKSSMLDSMPGIQIVPEPPKRIFKNTSFGLVESSRGCHYGACTFCSRSNHYKNNWYRIPIEKVTEAVKGLKNLGCTNFTFTDEDFIGSDLEGAIRIAEEIYKIGGLQFSLSLRADSVMMQKGFSKENDNIKRNELFTKLKNAGLRRVFIGLESLSDSQLRRYGKGINAEMQISVIRYLRNLNIDCDLGFILFDPLLTFDEMEKNISQVEKENLLPNIGWLFQELHVYKDTPFTKLLQNENLLGELIPDNLEFRWKYKNQDVADIAYYCCSLAKPIETIYRIIRSIGRSQFEQSEHMKVANEYRTFIQKLNFQTIKFAIINSKEGNFFKNKHIMTTQYNEEISNLFEKISKETPSSSLLQKELLNKTKIYLRKRKR